MATAYHDEAVRRRLECLRAKRGKRIEGFERDNVTLHLKKVIQDQSHALEHVLNFFPEKAHELVQKILSIKGRIVITGMGKSGIVAQKLAATFSSLSITSFFLHPSDAMHGDIGGVGDSDLCIVLSKSGAGSELEQLVPVLMAKKVFTVLISCAPGALAKKCDLSIVLPLEKEAGKLALAPTSSSTIMMVFGDAVALVASSYMGFSRKDFARNHPGGSLGKTLLLTCKYFMHTHADLPLVFTTTPFKDLILIITQKKLGIGIVIDQSHEVLGVITDGDIRRAYEEFDSALFNKRACDIMTEDPKTITPDCLAQDALKIMKNFSITSLIITTDEKVVGMVHIHDLIKAGIQ